MTYGDWHVWLRGLETTLRILVAEDDLRLATLLEESLGEAGWQADVVHDGRSAYQQPLNDSGFDVALRGWMLPSMDGVSIVRGVGHRLDAGAPSR